MDVAALTLSELEAKNVAVKLKLPCDDDLADEIWIAPPGKAVSGVVFWTFEIRDWYAAGAYPDTLRAAIWAKRTFPTAVALFGCRPAPPAPKEKKPGSPVERVLGGWKGAKTEYKNS